MKKGLVTILLALCMLLAIPAGRVEAATPVSGSIENSDIILNYIRTSISAAMRQISVTMEFLYMRHMRGVT